MSSKTKKTGEFDSHKINSWEEFDRVIVAPSIDKEMLFRGQIDAAWTLESTLYRVKNSEIEIGDYLCKAHSALKMLESMTEKKWDLSFDNFKQDDWYTFLDLLISEKVDERDIIKQEPLFEFLAYLRHYGYPTPLLDWTDSPYVAAFFAVSEQSENDSVVFSYQHSHDGGWVNSISETSYWLEVYPHSMPLRTHQRHYLQHSAYLISVRRKDGNSYFSSIEDALHASNANFKGQDIVKKYVIPRSMRQTFLQKINSMNINHMTLFADEQAMIKTLAMRHFGVD